MRNARMSRRIVTGLLFLLAPGFAAVHASPLTIIPTAAGLAAAIDQENFDPSALPVLTLGADAGSVTGAGATQYVGVLGGEKAVLNFGSLQNHPGTLLGSFDWSSEFAFIDGSDNVIGRISLSTFVELVAGNSVKVLEFYDITYSVNPQTGPVTVPVPASLWLTLAALAGICLLGRGSRQNFGWHVVDAGDAQLA